MNKIQTIILTLLLIGNLAALKIPGVSTKKLKKGQQVEIFASDIGEYSLFDYFCEDQRTMVIRDSPIDQLFDDSIYQMQFKAYLKVNQHCRRLCHRKKVVIPKEDLVDYYRYGMRFTLHDLKAVFKTLGTSTFSDYDVYGNDIPLIKSGGSNHLVNHFRFQIWYSDAGKVEGEDIYKIVKIEVMTKSLAAKPSNAWGKAHKTTYGCNYGEDVFAIPTDPVPADQDTDLFFTYDVVWKKATKSFGTNWDHKASAFSFEDLYVDSVMFSLVCFGLFSLIKGLINEFVKRKIKSAQEEESTPLSSPTAPVETQRISNNAWKFLSGDVFRPPKHDLVFCVTIGTGIQLCIVALISSLLICLSFTVEDSRGNIIIVGVVSYLFTSATSGFISSQLYKAIGGKNWLLCAVGSSILYPALGIIALTIINLIMSLNSSRFTLSTWDIITFISVWLGIFLPQVFIGSFIGFKRKKEKFPCKPNLVERTIKEQPKWLNLYTIGLVGGIIPVLFLMFQLKYIGDLLWSGIETSIIPAFICIILGGVMTLVVCGQVGIITSFILILYGNHRWWWASFISCASTGLYCFLFSIIGYVQYKLVFNKVFFFLFYFLLSAFISLACGAVGFLSSMRFMKYLYSQIKID